MTDSTAMTREKLQASFRGMIEHHAPQIKEILPQHMTPEKMIRIMNLAIGRTPALLECTPISVLTSIMLAARLGLAPDGALGSAYLVPFYNKKIGQKECQLIPGYRGLIDLARRSGEVSKIETRLVYPPDVFEVDYGLVRPLIHKPDYRATDRGEWYVVWAMATFKDGTVQLEVMTRDEVQGISTAKFGPWVDHFEEMARKTVVRRLAKYLPLSPELAAANLLQAGAEAGKSLVIEAGQITDSKGDPLVVDLADDVPQIEGRSRADALADAIGGEPEPDPVPEDREATAAEKLGYMLRDAADSDAAAAVWTEHETEIDGFTDDERAELQAIFEGKGA